jgi:hypothetical protein
LCRLLRGWMRGFEWDERRGWSGWLLSQSKKIDRSIDLEASSSRQYIDSPVFYCCGNGAFERSPRFVSSEERDVSTSTRCVHVWVRLLVTELTR